MAIIARPGPVFYVFGPKISRTFWGKCTEQSSRKKLAVGGFEPEKVRLLYPAPLKTSLLSTTIKVRFLQYFIGDIKLRFIKLSHAGKEYKDVEHDGVIIKGANQTILVSGDCEICDEKLLDETQNERIGISIMNFPWVTLRKGRAAIESLIKPKHLIVAHLPFEEDDIYGYFPATEKAIKNMDKAADIRVFHRFLQKECFE